MNGESYRLNQSQKRRKSPKPPACPSTPWLTRWAHRHLPRCFAPRNAKRYAKQRGALLWTNGTTRNTAYRITENGPVLRRPLDLFCSAVDMRMRNPADKGYEHEVEFFEIAKGRMLHRHSWLQTSKSEMSRHHVHLHAHRWWTMSGPMMTSCITRCLPRLKRGTTTSIQSFSRPMMVAMACPTLSAAASMSLSPRWA